MERNITVGFAVAVLPQAIPYFEKLGIDFCCGGQRLLENVIKEKGLSAMEVFQHLNDLENQLKTNSSVDDFLNMPSPDMIDYIVSVHHAYLRRIMPTISEYLTAVMRAHGANHPELFEISKLFGTLKAELEQHLLKEELFLFPSIKENLFQLVNEYIDEHEFAGSILAKLEKLTSNYNAPIDACETFVELYRKMQEMVEDIHHHIHLENNILFLRKHDKI